MTLREAWRDPKTPLLSHLGMTLAYNASLAALLRRAHVTRRLPERPSVWDLGLIGVAAYKVSRLIVTDQVTEPLRAPFTEDGKPTGRGMRRALGQLVSCPHCVAPWAVLGFGTGLVWAPRPTRYASGLFASMVVADVMHRGYSLLQSEQKELSAHAAITAARAQSIEGGAQP